MMPNKQHVNERLHPPLPAFCDRLHLPACDEVLAIRRLQVGGEIGALAQPLRRRQSIRRVREPGGVLGVRRPIALTRA